MRRLSRLAGGWAVGVIVLGAAGCSIDGRAISSDDAAVAVEADPQVTLNAIPPDGPPPSELVLTGAELPAGFEAMKIDPAKIAEKLDETLTQGRGATIEPAECAPVELIPDSIDVSRLGVITGTKGTSAIVTVTVLPATVGPSAAKRGMTGECSQLRVALPASDGAPASTATVRTVLKQAPRTNADAALVYEQSTTATFEGKEFSKTNLMGNAWVNGYLITVGVLGVTGAPSEADFNEVFVRAVNKVDVATS